MGSGRVLRRRDLEQQTPLLNLQKDLRKVAVGLSSE